MLVYSLWSHGKRQAAAIKTPVTGLATMTAAIADEIADGLGFANGFHSLPHFKNAEYGRQNFLLFGLRFHAELMSRSRDGRRGGAFSGIVESQLH